MSRWKAIIVDPNRLFREGLEKLLRSSKFAVLASVKRLNELNVALPTEEPDLIVFGFDRDMSAEEQFQYLSSTRARSPQRRVVLLTHSTETDLLLRAAAAGLDAVLSRDISSVVLQRSIELVMLGQQVFPGSALGSRLEVVAYPSGSPLAGGEQNSVVRSLGAIGPPAPASANGDPTKTLVRTKMPLSNREDQILQGLIAGAPNKVIARDLGITEGTVKIHVKSLCRKLGAMNRTQAAIWGQKQ